MRDRFSIFRAVIRNRKLSLLLVMTLRMPNTYHTILGRPSLTKFIAVPDYSCLVLKMPTKKGVLIVRGNVYTAYTCEQESFRVTKAIDLSARMAKTTSQAVQTSANQLEIPKLQAPRKNVKSKEHKEIQLVDNDPEKWLLSEPRWFLNRKTCLSGS